VDGVYSHTLGLEEITRVLGVTDGAAEDEGAGAGVLLPGAPHLLEAPVGVDGALELGRIEAAIAKRNRAVIGFVFQAVIRERDEQPLGDTFPEVGAVREVVVEEAGDVGAVGAFGRGGEAQEEARLDSIEDASIRGRRAVRCSGRESFWTEAKIISPSSSAALPANQPKRTSRSRRTRRNVFAA
jgi:hypothetical protein